MSSGAANFGRIRFDDLQWDRGYSPNRSYAQSKLADLMLTLRLAEIAQERGWDLLSTGAHPGYTVTNLQTVGPNLGRERPRRALQLAMHLLPKQQVGQGAEPLLYAAADPAARNGEYYGPSGRFELVGPTTVARVPQRARDAAVAKRLWDEAERITGVLLPA